MGQSRIERPRLPLVKAGSGVVLLPDAQAIEKLFATTKNAPESAQYFHDELQKKVISAGLTEEFKDVMADVKQFVSLVQSLSPEESKYWSGQIKDAAVSKFLGFQQGLSAKATETLVSSMTGKTIYFDFAIDNDAQLLQGFASDEGGLDEKTTEQFYAVYSDWLTLRGMVCQGGVVYEIDPKDGSIKKDKGGQLQKVKKDDYAALFQDKEKGFEKFVEVKTQGNLKVQVNDRSSTPQQSLE